MKRKTIIAANWKMNLTTKEANDLASKIAEKYQPREDAAIILFPSFLQIPKIKEILGDSPIGLGGQNIWFEKKGAYTGETAAFQLKEAGCTHVLIGHSERRHYFRENYETVNKKLIRAIKSELSPLLCVGESAEERNNAVTEMVVVDQISSAFENVKQEACKLITIAYEPIWAIGTGITPKPSDASHVHQIIRKTLRRIYDEDTAERIEILYGGSVNADNIKGYLKEDEIDGVLVGGASLKADSFLHLAQSSFQ